MKLRKSSKGSYKNFISKVENKPVEIDLGPVETTPTEDNFKVGQFVQLRPYVEHFRDGTYTHELFNRTGEVITVRNMDYGDFEDNLNVLVYYPDWGNGHNGYGYNRTHAFDRNYYWVNSAHLVSVG
jgi:hypothetical protein